jgi:hypothetical protein
MKVLYDVSAEAPRRPVLFLPLYSLIIVHQPDVTPIRIVAVLRGKRNLKRILRKMP